MNKTRRNFIKSVVLTLWKEYKEFSLPVPLKKIIKSIPNCRLIPYSRLQKDQNLSEQEVFDFCGTEDACTDYHANQNQYIIYYNDISYSSKIKSNRYRWSIAHELGHILLNHHKNHNQTRIFRNHLSDQMYQRLEEEADVFASYLLVPHAALCFFSIKDEKDIAHICKISSPAAKRRNFEYSLWLRKNPFQDEYDRKIRSLFFLSPVNKNHFICSNCKAMIEYFPGMHYCKICGHKKIRYQPEASNMIYPGVELDQNGKAKECPLCKNKESQPGEFCKICGESLSNRCANIHNAGLSEEYVGPCKESNGKPLPGNARFCPYCGSKTTFFQNQLLSPWKQFRPLPAFREEDLPF